MLTKMTGIVTIALTCLLINSCGATSSASQQAPTTTPTAPPQAASQAIGLPIAASPTTIQPQAAQSEYYIVPSLKERIATSKIIIIGEVKDEGEVINAASDTSNPTQPATNLFGVGQVYHVHATRYLKGTGSNILNIFQVEGIVDREPTAITQDEITQAKASYMYTPLQTGATYVFFLNPFTRADLKETYFVGDGGLPWRFALSPNGELQAEGLGTGTLVQPGGEFAPRPLAQFTAQIEQLVQAEKANAPTK